MSNKNINSNSFRIDNKKINNDELRYFKDNSNDYNVSTNSPLNVSIKNYYEKKKMNHNNNNNQLSSDVGLLNQLNFKTLTNRNFQNNSIKDNGNNTQNNYNLNNNYSNTNYNNTNNTITENMTEPGNIGKSQKQDLPPKINSNKSNKPQNAIAESLGNFTRTNLLKSSNAGNQDLDNKLISNNPINAGKDSNVTEKLIIKNLENELKERTDEIKVLKKNFKEKIDILEDENKKTIDQLEEQFNRMVENINKNHSDNVTGLELSNLQIKNEYDDLIAKFQRNILNLKSNSMPVKKHEEIIKELNTKSFVKFEEHKNIYQEKFKEVIKFFDKPDYKKLIENINFYIKFKEKIDFTPEDLQILETSNLSNQEFDIWMDRIKLNLVTAETDYINGIIELENNYLNLFEKIKGNEFEKFQILENEINKKFEVNFF